jgi:hypothetical protein
MASLGPRALTEDEAGVLAVLLAADFPGAQELREQLRTARATPGCGCGCGTIDLHVDAGAPRAAVDFQPSGATVVGADGKPIGSVLVFVQDGCLSSLEVAGFVDEPLPMPRPDELIDVTAGPSAG